jgi:hypothetical protein
MPMDYPLDNRQAHTGAFKFPIGMEPLKDMKKLWGVAHVESNSVIPDKEYNLLTFNLTADFNPRWFAPAGILDRIAQ